MYKAVLVALALLVFACGSQYHVQPVPQPPIAEVAAAPAPEPVAELEPERHPVVNAPPPPQPCKIATVSKKTRPLEALAMCGLMLEDQNLSQGDVCRTYKVHGEESVDCSAGKDVFLTIRTVERFKMFHMQANANPKINMYYTGNTDNHIAQFRLVVQDGRTGTCDINLHDHEAKFCETPRSN